MATDKSITPSEWAPLRIVAFRAIWFASLAANTGTWFQNVGGVWLMIKFSHSPILIALMQTATTLPVFLVGIPAGAMADIVNRRSLLLATQSLILIAATTLSVLTFAGLMNAPLLLITTFMLGLSAILANPAWQAVNTELVPPEDLPAAVTLSSVSYNLARAVGPAAAGLVIALAGPAAVFLLDALAFVYVVLILSLAPSPTSGNLACRAADRGHQNRSSLCLQPQSRTSGVPCMKCAACVNKMVPLAGSSHIIQRKKKIISNHLWRSPGPITCARWSG
jgi:MFS family permease